MLGDWYGCSVGLIKANVDCSVTKSETHQSLFFDGVFPIGYGAGGGFFLHAPDIAFTSPFATLEASGGSPNGAGGRILPLTTSGQSVSGRYAVSQGPSGGEPGVLQFGTLSGYFQFRRLVSNSSATPPKFRSFLGPLASAIGLSLGLAPG